MMNRNAERGTVFHSSFIIPRSSFILHPSSFPSRCAMRGNVKLIVVLSLTLGVCGVRAQAVDEQTASAVQPGASVEMKDAPVVGASRWQFKTGGSVYAMPVVVDGTV